jgi:hypothetical protein
VTDALAAIAVTAIALPIAVAAGGVVLGVSFTTGFIATYLGDIRLKVPEDTSAEFSVQSFRGGPTIVPAIPGRVAEKRRTLC